MSLRLVNKPIEDIVNPFPNKRFVNHKLPVDPMENGFQIISFSRIFGFEKLEEVRDERMIDKPFRDRSKPTRIGFTGRRRSGRGEERRRSRRGEERRRSVGGEKPRHLRVLDLGLGICARFLG